MDHVIEKSLLERFYASVPFPAPPAAVQDAVDAFFKFLEQPQEIKEYIKFSIAAKHRRGEVGFVHRDPNDRIYNDDKDFFHFHPAVFEEYGDFIEGNPVLKDFLYKAKPIWDIAYQTVGEILKALESHSPGAHAKVFDAPRVHLLLRFLKYNWQNSGKYLAKPHFDAGACTLAIAESCPGLRVGSNPDDLKPVEHQSDHALFMLSSNFKTVVAKPGFSAGWHDVIQTDESLIGKPFARWAVVAFIDAADVEAPSRAETHKWLEN